MQRFDESRTQNISKNKTNQIFNQYTTEKIASRTTMAQKPLQTEPASKSPFQYFTTHLNDRYQKLNETKQIEQHHKFQGFYVSKETKQLNFNNHQSARDGQSRNDGKRIFNDQINYSKLFFLGKNKDIQTSPQQNSPANQNKSAGQLDLLQSPLMMSKDSIFKDNLRIPIEVVKDQTEIPKSTPNQSILNEGSILAQKLPFNKFIKASGLRGIQLNPFTIKNKDTGQVVDLRYAQFENKKKNLGLLSNDSISKEIQNTLLLQYCKLNNVQKCIELISKKVEQPNINSHDNDGNSLLHLAAINDNSQLVGLFLHHQAVIDSHNLLKQTPLMLACARGLVNIAEKLITAGAEINATDNQMNTPLHHAAINSQRKIFELLLQKTSTDYTMLNRSKKTARELCPNAETLRAFDSYQSTMKVSKVRIHECVFNADGSANICDEKVGPFSFIVHGMIGKGSFGEVYLVEKKGTNSVFAMKVLHKSQIQQQNLTKYAVTERNILSVTRHPFIVRLRYAFQTIDKLFLILDYCPGGDLGEHLQREKSFPEERVRLYMTQLVLALEDLHKRDIIFRDLKPDNIVLDADGYALLTDFGLSKQGVLEYHTGARSFCGSVAYLAPEMLKRSGHGKAVDWYLLGVVMYELLVGIPPYYANNREELFNNIEKASLQIPSHISTEGKNLMKASYQQLLQRNPSKRLGSGKGDAEEIKAHKYFEDLVWDDVLHKRIQMQRLKRKIKIYRNQDQNVFEPSNLQESERQHISGWSFVDQLKT